MGTAHDAHADAACGTPLVSCVYRYTALQTLKDGVKFSNKALMNAAERLNVCTAAYDDLQREVVAVSWLKQPLVDVSAIRARHDMVEALTEDPELWGGSGTNICSAVCLSRHRPPWFRHPECLPDIDSLTRKLEARRIGLADLHALYRASAKLPLIVEALAAYEGPAAGAISTRYCQPLSAAHGEDTLVKFEELLEAALDLDRLPEEYLVSPEYDTRLAAQAEKRAEVEAEIQDLAQAAATDLGFILDKTIKLDWHKVSNRNNRCQRITNKEEKNVRQKLEKKWGQRVCLVHPHEPTGAVSVRVVNCIFSAEKLRWSPTVTPGRKRDRQLLLVIRDHDTQQSKGYGFVSYSHPVYALHAMQTMDGARASGAFQGRKLQVTHAHKGGLL
ncbi:MAG: hypothetical protein WDW36_008122 [Sanguina aurantia]